jgi:D-serine dehydratase
MPPRLDLSDVLAEPVTGETVGFPSAASTIVGAVGTQGWHRRDLGFPCVALREEALEHNIARMARYAHEERVLLAPHGKTTMAPQLWQRQLDAGAWAITAATPAQARTMRRVGVPRVLIANEVVDPDAIGWLAASLADEGWSVSCWVDDVNGVALLADGLRRGRAARPLDVMVEVGHPGGRAGVRTVDAAVSVARAVDATAELRFAGVAAFEGTIGTDRSHDVLGRVDRFLDTVREAADAIIEDGRGRDGEVIVSAGGSIYFDRVVAHLRDGWPTGTTVRTVLRPGCTITHDHGLYARSSPLGEDGFRPAFDVRATVLSCPEPGRFVVGAGKRDLSSDIELPTVIEVAGRTAEGVVVDRLMDQHALCVAPPDLRAHPGDEVILGISHPCAAFDRRRVIPVLDEDDRVVSAIATRF